MADTTVASHDLIAYADCLGAGDAYADDAVVYGYDRSFQDDRADRQMAELADHPASPGLDRLKRARREGRVTYDALGNALNGQMEGPAWDLFTGYSIRCGQLRDRLDALGVITED